MHVRPFFHYLLTFLPPVQCPLLVHPCTFIYILDSYIFQLFSEPPILYFTCNLNINFS